MPDAFGSLLLGGRLGRRCALAALGRRRGGGRVRIGRHLGQLAGGSNRRDDEVAAGDHRGHVPGARQVGPTHVVVDVEDAVTAAFFRRRLICRPSSSSDDVNPESESDEAAAAAGGVAARLRKFALAFADRFLNVTCGISAGVSTVVFSSVMVADCCSNDGTRVDQDSWLIRNHLV